jgi:RHS repeat-associated protein
VWDGDQILYEISSRGGTANTATEMEQDTTQQLVDQTGPDAFAFGRVVYTHGAGLDNPLSLIRIGYSTLFPEPLLIVPLTNWQGHFDTGEFVSQYCKQYPPYPQQGQNYCVEIQWPAPYMWKTMYVRSRSYQGPRSWMGSLIEEGRDASGQMYRRNRYYDPASGRFTQEDPIGLAGGLNAYGFAGGDPVNFGDPFGLCPAWLEELPYGYGAIVCAAWEKQEAEKEKKAEAAETEEEAGDSKKGGICGLTLPTLPGGEAAEEATEFWASMSIAAGKVGATDLQGSSEVMGHLAALWTPENQWATVGTLLSAYGARVIGPFSPKGLPPGVGRVRGLIRFDPPHHNKLGFHWDGRFVGRILKALGVTGAACAAGAAAK